MSLLITLILSLSSFSFADVPVAPMTFPAAGVKTVNISVPKGKISLSSSKNQKDISVTVVGPKKDDGKKCIKSVGLENAEFFVKISSENILFEKADCDFDVTVVMPMTASFDMDISSGSAQVTIKELNGAINLKTATGDVFVQGDVLKNVTAKTATGALNFSYKTCNARADLDFMSATGKTSIKLPASCKIRVDYKSATGKLFNAIGESKDYQVLINAKSASGDLTVNKY
ncbi:DUF4097 family beta strand repeat-containing protein [Bacteriovorax sp. PP10]|uniref:DUF4097 family beta strand repeat-containing protein n=1 Tax=Bacteriovorax antarcticus TaxID=3088717 RepID=A0ABU5W1Q5_9BACT|nr:DUF4097 family beta strand repeat-containing protein [Bacteriovorax sp. PP10]MEA9358190.1 DUF4097 family beta strand repeat-containing protein [Bacteriovorax sp. PP10]